jgi:hypothetical protein
MNCDSKRLVREINDRIYGVMQGLGSEDGDFLCECGSEKCGETARITLREYAALRARDEDIVQRRGRRLRAAP